ncbi:site-specific integrase [Paenibacillus cymbidii]|uniref:hypothetical protein n=1 Tax=Paenibacillus cymbidii TaxID=1639034 RepID=UPI0038B3A7B2
MNVIKAHDLNLLVQRLPFFPWYVEQYIQHKLVALSPSTLLEYTRDFEFFQWLIQEGLASSPSINQIPLSDLEKLQTVNIDTYPKKRCFWPYQEAIHMPNGCPNEQFNKW